MRLGEGWNNIFRVLLCFCSVIDAVSVSDLWGMLVHSTAVIPCCQCPRKEHPDVSKLPDAKQRWQELSAAYDALSDPETCLRMILLLVVVGAGGCGCRCCLMIGS